ncbi:nucleotidyltransferase family protein [Deinococcus radiodurans]|uniref:nucleotidyltransferase family protein n=1 Tax=Deinococcus radiodurans TaxID=1299 RepID=UPI001FB7A909|nr:nucleotidyltransferase family protein [Deinococcus radiodurans]
MAGSLFGTVWNVQSSNDPAAHIKDYDLFYWDADLSYEAEDAVIRRAALLFADLSAPIELRNQARVHLWFNPKHGLNRPPIRSVQEGIDQFLIECTCLGIDAQGNVYAPYGLDDMAAGLLKRNALNHSPGLYAAKAESYRARWPWLRDVPV